MLDWLRRLVTTPPPTETVDDQVARLVPLDQDPRGIGDAEHQRRLSDDPNAS